MPLKSEKLIDSECKKKKSHDCSFLLVPTVCIKRLFQIGLCFSREC